MHLIRRYPKIFSNFATILQAERPYCDAIGRYVKQIYQNSQERDFQKLCRKSIKKIACAMEENHRTRVRSLSSALQLAPTADDLRSPPRPVNPVDICMDTVLADALENLFSFSYKVAPQAIKSISASGSSTKCSDISQPDLVDLISASHITATPPDTCLVHFMEIESDSGSLTSIYELDQDLDLPCPNSPQEQMLVSPTLRSPAFSDWSDVLSSGTQLSHEDDVGFNARPSLLSADDPPLCSPPRAADDMDAWNIFIDPEDVLIVDDILAL
ncbi:hypothetical protein SISSUDRAFT_1118191 [Sistotremastrum suecicum HHB10207 ss-3]|uniref:Uncharacterized protein n=1 Tax=Sistotremastrum suecicum HHB10207 ss-3 TaxID=1314776 RepID=A0A166FI41_9AGAM|nr:hypothetical protein SISSUDRAFT_1118191 [Sistotremastrum suecicum HHB10207 ss-3]